MVSENLLTVIVPVYNIENYIENCIDSIINQSFKNLKVIIIDDCSTDNTHKLALTYSQRYTNITVIRNKKNRGVSYCRNHGLSLVETKYVAFLDGDDWLDLNCYTKALKHMEQNNRIDIALWNINTVYSRSHCIKRYFYEEENLIDNKYALKLFCKSQNSNIYISPLLGNKVIRTKLIKENNITFNGRYYEDDIFIFYCFLLSDKIQIIAGAYLYYFQRDGSAMHSFSPTMIQEFFIKFSDLRKNLIKYRRWIGYESCYYSYYEKCIKNLLILIRNTVKTESEERQILSCIYELFYEKTHIPEYINYCDLRLFPF